MSGGFYFTNNKFVLLIKELKLINMVQKVITNEFKLFENAINNYELIIQ